MPKGCKRVAGELHCQGSNRRRSDCSRLNMTDSFWRWTEIASSRGVADGTLKFTANSCPSRVSGRHVSWRQQHSDCSVTKKKKKKKLLQFTTTTPQAVNSLKRPSKRPWLIKINVCYSETLSGSIKNCGVTGGRMRVHIMYDYGAHWRFRLIWPCLNDYDDICRMNFRPPPWISPAWLPGIAHRLITRRPTARRQPALSLNSVNIPGPNSSCTPNCSWR